MVLMHACVEEQRPRVHGQSRENDEKKCSLCETVKTANVNAGCAMKVLWDGHYEKRRESSSYSGEAKKNSC